MTTELNTVNREYITWQYQELNFGLLGGLKIEGLERMRVTMKVEYRQLAVRHSGELQKIEVSHISAGATVEPCHYNLVRFYPSMSTRKKPGYSSNPKGMNFSLVVCIISFMHWC
jgi:hypothetical protein